MVYKADLNLIDIQNLSSMEGKNKDVLPKKRTTVAIKRIFNRQDELGKQGCLGEVENKELKDVTRTYCLRLPMNALYENNLVGQLILERRREVIMYKWTE